MHQSCCSFGVAGSCFYAFGGGTGWTELFWNAGGFSIMKLRYWIHIGYHFFPFHKVSKTHAFSKEWGKSNNGFLLSACQVPYLFLTRRCSEQGCCYGVLEETLPLSSHTIQDDGQILKGCARGHPLHLEFDYSLWSANNGPNNELNKKHISGHLWEAKFFGSTLFCPSSRLCSVPLPDIHEEFIVLDVDEEVSGHARGSRGWTLTRVVTSRHLGFILEGFGSSGIEGGQRSWWMMKDTWYIMMMMMMMMMVVVVVMMMVHDGWWWLRWW